MDVLAQELIDSVVDEIDSHSDLKACSLAARVFVEPCQRRLFREMHFFDGNGVVEGTFVQGDTGIPARSAYLLLHTSPHLRSYVRSLAIDGVETVRDPGFSAMTSILRILHNITHLALICVNWNDEFTDFTNAISASILRPSLQSLTMVISHFTDSTIHLDVLPPLFELKRFTWRAIQPANPHVLEALATKCQDSLENLTVGLPVFSSYIPTIILPRLELLRSLELRFIPVSTNTLSALFAAIPDPLTAPYLETLTMLLVEPRFIMTGDAVEFDFDARLELWRHLRAFNLDIRMERSDPGDTQDHPLFAYIQAQLPKAWDRGLLTFSIDVIGSVMML
ncbi:hypothetical protein C8R43DRAFT_1190601 [Mycena crocata]|nr:hypothetical protein C8R43DRAFT_1190601 [Mycena crocata]